MDSNPPLEPPNPPLGLSLRLQRPQNDKITSPWPQVGFLVFLLILDFGPELDLSVLVELIVPGELQGDAASLLPRCVNLRKFDASGCVLLGVGS